MPFLAPLVLLTARKTAFIVSHYDQPMVQRYRLPKWMFPLETPDELLPGGLYEPTVQKIYDRFGWFVTAWYWIGWRNVGCGLWWLNGTPADNDIRTRVERRALGLKLITGYSICRDRYRVMSDSPEWKVPVFSLRLSSQD